MQVRYGNRRWWLAAGLPAGRLEWGEQARDCQEVATTHPEVPVRRWSWCGIALAVGVATGCSSGSDSTGTTGADSVATARSQVVARINQLRATVSLPALTEWTAQAGCADTQAHTDAAANASHTAFGTCQEAAQNECPGWPAMSQIAATCVEQMWNEGPGADFNTHGHYINMTSTSYHKVAVGFYTTSTGTVWALMNFAP